MIAIMNVVVLFLMILDATQIQSTKVQVQYLGIFVSVIAVAAATGISFVPLEGNPIASIVIPRLF